jgi:Nickel responsive protein SCO4226-like
MRRDVRLQPIFLVERYLPGLTEDALTALAVRLMTAGRTICATGTAASWLGSTALLAEETTFCAFVAPSGDAVRALNRLAAAPYERVTEALLVGQSWP